MWIVCLALAVRTPSSSPVRKDYEERFPSLIKPTDLLPPNDLPL